MTWRSRSAPSQILAVLLLPVVLASCGGRGQEKAGDATGEQFSAFLEPGQGQFTAFAGETVLIRLLIRNTGKTSWSSRGEHPLSLSYHLLDTQKKVLRWDNPRSVFPQRMKPGDSLEMMARVKAPLEAGVYYLEFDVVREGVAWFKDLGSPTALVMLRVKENIWPETRESLTLDFGRFSKLKSSREEFNKLAQLIRITLHHNDVAFKGQTGKVSAFSAGTSYSQVWIRDATTIIPASKFFYGEAYLSSWLEEFLAFQKSDGSLPDWFDSQGKTDKNTTETDQETSAVLAAFEIFKLKGTDWLKKKVRGETVLTRLEKALLSVLSDRFEETLGLIKGAHTIDWGDVDIVDPGGDAVYADGRTHWTVDIYDQSLFFQAACGLATMFEAQGQKERAMFWTVKAASIQENAKKWLWQKDRGYFRVHLHLDSLQHDFDEDGIFALGGNVSAMLSGLADETQGKSIIERALERQAQYGLSTISGVLLPPYPSGVFKHPLVDEPYEYQNGGQWDWFGGKLLFSMFVNGYSETAKKKLLEVARKNMANGGLFEWEDRLGTARGSDMFSGSAGSLGLALFEGYLGIHLTRNSLRLEPRLGRDEAEVHLYVPATGLFAAYEYELLEEGRKVRFSYNSNFAGTGLVRILLPWDTGPASPEEGEEVELEVTLDGKSAAFKTARLNEDRYVEIETDFRHRTLIVRRLPANR